MNGEAVWNSLSLRFSSTKFNVCADPTDNTRRYGCVHAAGVAKAGFWGIYAGNRLGDEDWRTWQMRTLIRWSPAPRVGMLLMSIGAAILLLAAGSMNVQAQNADLPPLSNPPVLVTLSNDAPLPPAAAAPLGDGANLEQRMRELETLIRQMQSQSDQHGAISASASLPDLGMAPDSSLPQTPPPAFNPVGPEGPPNQIFPPRRSRADLSPGGGRTASSSSRRTRISCFELPGKFKSTTASSCGPRIARTLTRSSCDARFGLEATVFKYFDFRLLPDFGQGTTVDQDAYMNVHYWNEVQFEIGRFKQPISYEQLIQDRFVPTLERSIIDQLVPARFGAMVHGEDLLAGRFDYAASISNGEINGNSTDTNNHKDVNGRVALRPLNDPDNSEWLRYLGVGVSGGFGIEQEPMNPSTLRTPDTVPFFVLQPHGARGRVAHAALPRANLLCRSVRIPCPILRRAPGSTTLRGRAGESRSWKMCRFAGMSFWHACS